MAITAAGSFARSRTVPWRCSRSCDRLRPVGEPTVVLVHGRRLAGAHDPLGSRLAHLQRHARGPSRACAVEEPGLIDLSKRGLLQLLRYLGERFEPRSFAEARRRHTILGVHDEVAANEKHRILRAGN